jgi:gliding motility-associated-like protein
MRFPSFLLVLLLLPSLAFGQYVSRLGRFQVDEQKGCAPFTLTILNTNLITVGECTGVKPCDMNWGDGTTPQQNQFTHTYTQPGTYTLQILYQTIGFDDIVITVTPNTQPTFDVFTCGGREVQVRVTDTSYDSYIINYNDATPEVAVPKGSLAVDNHTYATVGLKNISVRGKNVDADDNCTPPATKSVTVVNALTAPFIDLLTVTSGTQVDLNLTNLPNTLYRMEIAVNSANPANFQLVQLIHDITTATIPNLRTDDNFYCFRLGAFDFCNNVTVYSNIICSANFDLTLQSNINNLTWTSSAAGVTNFTVNRDGSAIGSTGAFVFPDNTVVCNTNYCYQLITNYGNGSQSISLEKCGVAFTTDVPTAVQNVTAVVGNGSVDLTWFQAPAFQAAEYRIFRKSGNENLNLLTTATTLQFTDPTYTTDETFCYRIDYEDVCDNLSSPGIEVCPIRLSGNVASDNSITLNWSEYTGWFNGVDHYEVDKYDDQGVLLQTFNTGLSTTLLDNATDVNNQLYRYVVRAVANDPGLGQAISNEITMVKEPNLFYPKAFTPDNQGPVENEVFKVFGQFIVTFEMKIFNRWGEMLFSTKDINQGWDGKYKGITQPEGTYAFIANITDLAGRKSTRSGSVVLLKKN